MPAFLTGMSSFWNEISSQKKRVNSMRIFTIDRNDFRDDFIPGQVSCWDEIISVYSEMSLTIYIFLPG